MDFRARTAAGVIFYIDAATFGNSFAPCERGVHSILLKKDIIHMGDRKRRNELRQTTFIRNNRLPSLTYCAESGIALMMNKA